MAVLKPFFLATLLFSISLSLAVPAHITEDQHAVATRAGVDRPLDPGFYPFSIYLRVAPLVTDRSVPSSVSDPAATSPHNHQGGVTTRRTKPTSVIVVTIILAVVFLLGAFFGLIRFLRSCWKTPHYDRLAVNRDREMLQREIMYGEQQLAFGDQGLAAPPPPYFPRPPNYADSDADPLEDGILLQPEAPEHSRRNMDTTT